MEELAWAIVAGEIFHQRAGIGTPLEMGTIVTFDLRAGHRIRRSSGAGQGASAAATWRSTAIPQTYRLVLLST